MSPAQELQQSKRQMNWTLVAHTSQYCRVQVSGNLQYSKIRKGMANIADLSGRKGLLERKTVILLIKAEINFWDLAR